MRLHTARQKQKQNKKDIGKETNVNGTIDDQLESIHIIITSLV